MRKEKDKAGTGRKENGQDLKFKETAWEMKPGREWTN